MSTDFFDDDLLMSGRGGSGYEDFDEDGNIKVLPVSEMGLNKLARQKKEVSSQMAGAVQKIEHLRSRQENLEKEKRELEELALRQDEYESGKKDIIEKLERWLIMLEREQNQATRMVALLGETSARFSESMAELKGIDENSWPEDGFQIELNKALVKVDIARNTYNKAIAKIEATSWHKHAGGSDAFEVVKEAGRELKSEHDFFYWLKVGFAVTLPLIILLIACFAAWLHFSGKFGV